MFVMSKLGQVDKCVNGNGVDCVNFSVESKQAEKQA